MDVKSVSEVRVTFRKVVSDRVYGNEVAEVALTAAIGGQQDAGEVAAALAVEARRLVTEQLRGSPSEHVQHAVETRQEREAREAAERVERERRQDLSRQERFAGAVAADDDDEDGDDGSPF